MSFTKTKLALGVAAATLTLVGAQAQAAGASAERVADAAARKTEALEAQMQQMAEQMQAMQAELNRVKTASSAKASTETAKIQELDHWMASVKAAPEASHSKDHQVVVRGGWSALDHARGNDSFLKDGALLSNNRNNEGYYYGGAFDFNVNNDLFGLVDDTSFVIELGVEYSSYGQAANTVSETYAQALLGDGAAGVTTEAHRATDARLRINASPKIKFMHGSKFRPWLIPVGLDINVLGVPTNAVSVLSSGMNFGAGAEYDIFRGIVVGTDVRYHYSTSKLDGTPVDGFNAGGYVGFKF
ncbi:hypothetical protein [Methylomonas sp. UP202]|uniref:hypothetical protein n=1 Tax=Methylomonas sp. UP202 TaxID=3040943 RepID=UPI00247A05D8|nr:hypothetical protein [Methylomonas sp. UP202]WGS85612.1 hypothetical protein QC632_21665 [Methylomonas sp. UP202]